MKLRAFKIGDIYHISYIWDIRNKCSKAKFEFTPENVLNLKIIDLKTKTELLLDFMYAKQLSRTLIFDSWTIFCIAVSYTWNILLCCYGCIVTLYRSCPQIMANAMVAKCTLITSVLGQPIKFSMGEAQSHQFLQCGVYGILFPI